VKTLLAKLAAISLIFSAAPFIALAQNNSPQDTSDQAVKLQPGVARVSFVHGDVSSQRGDNGEWVAASLNTPIVEGDRVATGEKSRAELQLDWADILRMSDSATAKVASLSRTNIQVQVGQGLVTYNVLKGSEAASQIDTPNASIHPEGPGEFRILVNSDAETQVVVREGSATISTPQGSTRVEKGQMITVAGTDNAQYQTASAPGKDDWDGWNNDRNKRISSAESWHKTNRYYTGSEDLDAYGSWTTVPDYGPVWVPAVGPGWAPYRYGAWGWYPYYGWTWVSYEPWGWAPYHYGRWLVYAGNWAWWPGPVYAYPAYYPVWAPAYVSFFGYGGGGWGFSFGFSFGGGYGHYGWLPCGPGDWYHPWYGGWGHYGSVVNVTNVYNTTVINNYPTHGGWRNGFAPLGGRYGSRYSNINDALHNEHVRGGISSMSSSDFGRRGVPAHQEGMSEAAFRQASVVTGRMPIGPSRESYNPSGKSAKPAAYRNAPPATQHFFNGGTRPSTPLGAPSPTFKNAGTGRGPSGGNGDAGLRPHDRLPTASGGNSGSSTNGAPNQPNRPGWHSFTPPTSSGGSHSSQGFHAAPQPAQDNSKQSSTPPAHPSSPATPHGLTSQTHTGIPQQDRGSWQHFTPPAHSAPQAAPQTHAGTPQQDRGSWQHSTPPAHQAPSNPDGVLEQPYSPQQHEFRSPASTQASRGNNSGPYSYQRPPLNMQQPIVRPREGTYGYGAPHGSYSQPRGGYGGPSGGYSAPHGGGYSAPRGGGYSAPHGGGGSSNHGESGSNNGHKR